MGLEPRRLSLRLRRAALFLLAAFPAALAGLPPTPGPRASALPASASTATAYGTSGTAVYTLTAFDFVPYSNASFQPIPGTPYRYFDGPVEAPVRLPSGARILAVEVEACHLLPGEGEYFGGHLAYAGSPAGVAVEIVNFVTGDVNTPGCGRYSEPVVSPYTVDNAANKYWVEIQAMPTDGSVFLAAVRIFYQLQVSPAPATATFSDVPTTSPQFRFVEALVAAGITAGCGGGNYCPDQPVTRGQMAVFLSTALGLYWPD